MPRTILHIDMDAFYASVEQRDDPALRGRPVIVGGDPSRGVVLAASYEVRRFGVRSAMPMARALRQAPEAVVVPPRFSAYAEASRQVFAIFESVTDLVEPLSLDEAFLDVSGSGRLFGPGAAIAQHIRDRVAREVGLPASAGIAAVKFVAKIASDLAKPAGQREVPAEETAAFLAPLPVGRLWGVGPRLEAALQEVGLRTVGHVAAQDAAFLARRFGEAGARIHALSRGIDERPVVPDRQAKSIGAEDTFVQDVSDPEVLNAQIHGQAVRVGLRLRRAGLRTRLVQLKLKYADFTLVTRRAPLELATSDGQTLYRAAARLLEQLLARELRPVRLTGVAALALDEQERQLALFDRGERRAARLNAALDEITQRFGGAAIVPADLAGAAPANDREEEARRQVGVARYDAPDPRTRRPR